MVESLRMTWVPKSNFVAGSRSARRLRVLRRLMRSRRACTDSARVVCAVQTCRMYGEFMFVVLRDATGTVQVVVGATDGNEGACGDREGPPSGSTAAHEFGSRAAAPKSIPTESVVRIVGKVRHHGVCT